MTLSFSDYLEIASIAISAILTIVSLTISIIAVKQSQKSIKLTEQSILDANRPYIVVYRDHVQVLSSVHEYTIIKNFGKTGAFVDSLTFTPKFKDSLKGRDVFGHISGTFIAPGQAISTVSSINVFSTPEDTPNIDATISYHDSINHYTDHFTLTTDILHDLYFSKSNPSKNKTVQEVITKASEELIRKSF